MKVKLLKITQIVSDAMKRVKLTMTNGNVNTMTAIQYSANGDDSPPIKNSIGAYALSEMDGRNVCLGIMTSNTKAASGEKRLYCTDENGVFKCVIWLKNDGTMLQGDSDVPSEYTNFATKYNESKDELDKLKSTVDDLVTKWNAFCGSYAPGSPSTVGTPPTLSTSTVSANSSDFSLIKNSKIKYNE